MELVTQSGPKMGEVFCCLHTFLTIDHYCMSDSVASSCLSDNTCWKIQKNMASPHHTHQWPKFRTRNNWIHTVITMDDIHMFLFWAKWETQTTVGPTPRATKCGENHFNCKVHILLLSVQFDLLNSALPHYIWYVRETVTSYTYELTRTVHVITTACHITICLGK